MVMFNADFEDKVDFFFGDADRYPLLSADQELSIDEQKWDFAHRALLTVLKTSAGRSLVLDVCESILTDPADIEAFQQRHHYFSLKRDLKPLANEKRFFAPTRDLIDAITGNAPETELSLRLEMSEWPATLMIAIAIMAQRACGGRRKDTITDALEIWQPRWAHWDFSGCSQIRTALEAPVQGYLSARDKLVMHNIRLVYKLARENQTRGIPVRDLVQEGIIGLVRAAEKFDYRLGYRFSTYAYNWTNQHIQRICEGNGSLVTYPTHVTQEVNSLHRVRNEIVERTGQEPSVVQLAELTGFSEAKVRDLRQLTNLTVSIEAEDDDDSPMIPESALLDDDTNPTIESAQSTSLKRLINRQLQKLDGREQLILTARWGLDGRPTRTLAQLADQLEVSRELVRQLEKSALRKLQVDAALNDAFQQLSA